MGQGPGPKEERRRKVFVLDGETGREAVYKGMTHRLHVAYRCVSLGLLVGCIH